MTWPKTKLQPAGYMQRCPGKILTDYPHRGVRVTSSGTGMDRPGVRANVCVGINLTRKRRKMMLWQNIAATLSAHAEPQKTLRADQVLTPDSWESGLKRSVSWKDSGFRFPRSLSRPQTVAARQQGFTGDYFTVYLALITRPLPDDPLRRGSRRGAAQ